MEDTFLEQPRPTPSRRGLGRGLGAIIPARMSHPGSWESPTTAKVDVLTGLVSRPELVASLDRIFAAGAADQGSVALLVFGIDGFRRVNARYGHDEGDVVLRAVADRLEGMRRTIDTAARVGGDEFALVCPRVDVVEAATRIADRLVEALERPVSTGIADHRLTVTIGIAVARPAQRAADSGRLAPDSPGPGVLARDLLRRADMSMHQAKDQGVRWVLNDSSTTEARCRPDASCEIPDAAIGDRDEDSLSVRYLPVRDLLGRALVAVSADFRLPPVMPLVGGQDPPAEGHEAVLTAFRGGMERVLFDVSGWLSDVAIDDEFRVWVDVPLAVLSDPAMWEAVERLPAKYGVPVSTLGFRIAPWTSQGAAMAHEVGAADSAVDRLGRAGASCSLDPTWIRTQDLAALLRLPFRCIRLSTSLTERASLTTQDEAVLRAVVTMARDLGLAVIAEGVRDETHALALRMLGCTQAEGQWSGSRCTASDVLQLLG